jgi:hypothetical protein
MRSASFADHLPRPWPIIVRGDKQARTIYNCSEPHPPGAACCNFLSPIPQCSYKWTLQVADSCQRSEGTLAARIRYFRYSHDVADLEAALSAQKSFWKLCGILVAVLLCFAVFGFLLIGMGV